MMVFQDALRRDVLRNTGPTTRWLSSESFQDALRRDVLRNIAAADRWIREAFQYALRRDVLRNTQRPQPVGASA